MEIRDNSKLFLEKMYQPFDAPPVRRQQGRRLISVAGGKRKIFAPTIRGEDVFRSGATDSSGVISMGDPLPSPSELASHEEGIERRKQFSKDKKIPVPIPLPKNRDGRFKI